MTEELAQAIDFWVTMGSYGVLLVFIIIFLYMKASTKSASEMREDFEIRRGFDFMDDSMAPRVRWDDDEDI